MALGPLPSPGPFGRIVDVRVWPHGFSTEQGDIVRPNIEDAAWHAGAGKWGGNIVWTGSTVRHTIAYNGPRGRYFGPLSAGSFRAMKSWFAHNGAKVDAPSGLVLAACVKTYDSLPTSQTYAGTGDGTLDVQTPSTATGALTGDYEVRCIEAAPVPRFLVTGPDAQPIGVAEAGSLLGGPVLFDGVLRFTLQSGGIAFAVGDAWIVIAEEAEQFVVIVTPAVGGTSPVTETVWRRGVSLTPGSSWKQIGSVAPVSAQVDGSIQPWFINASATRAVTCRGLGADASGYTNGVVGRTLNLDTLAVTDAAETSTPPIYTVTRVVNAVLPPESAHPGQASDVTITNTTPSTLPVAQLMALDYDGDAAVRVEIEVSGSCTGSSHMFVLDDPDWLGSRDFNDNQHETNLTTTYSALADVVWRVGGAEVLRHVAFSLSGSGSYDETWFATPDPRQATLSESFTHQPIMDVAGPRGERVANTRYAGAVSSEWNQTGGAGGDGAYQQSASSVQLQHLVGGAVVAETLGGSGPHGFTPASVYWGMQLRWPGWEGDPGPPYSAPIIGVGGLGSQWRIVRGVGSTGETNDPEPTTDNTLPSVNTTTGRGFQTSAQDTRGNWLMAAEIAAFGTTDMRFPGQISASGTYTLQAGGPDTLTAAQVASLTAYAPHDRWNIGAF